MELKLDMNSDSKNASALVGMMKIGSSFQKEILVVMTMMEMMKCYQRSPLWKYMKAPCNQIIKQIIISPQKYHIIFHYYQNFMLDF